MPTTALDVLHGAWTLDPAASTVTFSIRHLGVATVHGAFDDADGTLELRDGLASATGRGHVRVASVRTGDAKRDAVLQSPDFFDAQRFPELTFASVAFRPLGERRFEVDGDLVVRGVTERVTLAGQLDEVTPGEDEAHVRLRLTGKLDRRRFGMPFADTPGSALVADAVGLRLDLVVRRAGEAQQA